MFEKVTIVTPTWNSDKYICETINSVLQQTYKNWEMIIVDNGSTDNTLKIVNNFMEKDNRIKLYRLYQNKGASFARNIAIKNSTGRYIAYLDSDDKWKQNKLTRQIQFMRETGCAFSCTSYEVINDFGEKLNKKIFIPKEINYSYYLTNNILQTVGIMVDLQQIDKKLLKMPNIKIGEDAATWLQILKEGNICFGINEILAEYRRRNGSLSSNKFISVKYAWNLYRNIEKLPLLYSIYCFIRYALLAIYKRIYF